MNDAMVPKKVVVTYEEIIFDNVDGRFYHYKNNFSGM
jgi:hypothetical protein